MGKQKTYRAKSEVSINVVLKNGKSKHISFLPVTGGGSVYRTDNEDIQAALESHYRFGNLFRIVDEPEQKSPKIPLKDKKKKQPKEEDQNPNEEKDGLTEKDMENETEGDEADEVTDTDGESEEDEDDGLRVVTVTCTSDAKEYLADTFGISRTNLRSKAKIIEAAAKNGIKFEGLDE